jgi:hypothetical protein
LPLPDNRCTIAGVHTVELRNAAPRNTLDTTSTRVESRARAMQRALLLWLQQWAAILERRIVAEELGRVELKKASRDREAEVMRARLRELIAAYGLRQMRDAAQGVVIASAKAFSVPPRVQRLLGDPAASAADVLKAWPKRDPPTEAEIEAVRYIKAQDPRPSTTAEALSGIKARLAERATGTELVRPGLVADYLASKEPLLQGIMASAERSVREHVRETIATAMGETPRPSTQEIARRIARTIHGKAGGRVVERIAEGGKGILPTTRLRTEGVDGERGGVVYEFSAERAMLIARTELAQAENTGLVRGYEVAGAEYLQWLAYDDGRSGERHHEKMHHVTIAVGESFTLPSGAELAYPGDPSGPIGETANCRCTVRAFRTRTANAKRNE